MSFVKDDHGYTRGVGAIASTDAGSPRRRIAASRAAVAMRRRDALMAKSAMGAISTLETGGGGGGGGPILKTLPPKTTVPTAPTGTFVVKSPGTVISAPVATFTTTPKPIATFTTPTTIPKPIATFTTPTTMPPKIIPGATITMPAPDPMVAHQAPTETIVVRPPPSPPETKTVVVGGGGGGSGSIAPLPTPPELPPPLEPIPDLPEEGTRAAPSKSVNLLLYAALGIGAWWLLTRK